MAAYKQDIKVKYGDFTFPVPTPYVSRTYEQEYVGGELWATKVNVSINGQIAILPKREKVGGNNYSALAEKRDKIAKEFAGGLGKNFKDFSVIGHGTEFKLKSCSIDSLQFESGNYVGLVGYSISLHGYLEEETSGKGFYETNYGVTSPVDSWAYSESGGIGSLTHTISASGYNSDKSGSSYDAFLKAKSFVESRKGLDKKPNGASNKMTNFFVSNVHPDSSLILNTLAEQADRLGGTYSITEGYSFATNKSSVAAGLEAGLPNPQTKNILTTYSIGLPEEHGSDFIQLTISGNVNGSKDPSVSWEDVRNDFKALDFYDLANKAYINHTNRTEVNLTLNRNPVSFNISPSEEAKRMTFSIVYDNNPLYTRAVFKNGGAYFSYTLNFSHDTIADVVTVQCSGSIITRGSLKKSNRQAKILLDELLDKDMKKLQEEAQKAYHRMFPDRTQYKLTNFPEGVSVGQNEFTGEITLSASFSDRDHFEKADYVKRSSFQISVNPPNQEYRTAASCLNNGDHIVYDLNLKTKRETVGINCDGASSSSDEDNFDLAVKGIEDLNEKLKISFLTGRVKRLDSQSNVANLIPNDITFNRGLSHEKDVITLRMDKQTTK